MHQGTFVLCDRIVIQTDTILSKTVSKYRDKDKHMPVGFSRVMGTGVMGEGDVLIILNAISHTCLRR